MNLVNHIIYQSVTKVLKVTIGKKFLGLKNVLRLHLLEIANHIRS